MVKMNNIVCTELAKSASWLINAAQQVKNIVSALYQYMYGTLYSVHFLFAHTAVPYTANCIKITMLKSKDSVNMYSTFGKPIPE